MAGKRVTPTPVEGTEERTIEFDVDAMSEELADAAAGAGDGAVE